MKKIIIVFTLFVPLFGYNQTIEIDKIVTSINDTTILNFETKNMSLMGSLMRTTMNFKLYNDSLVSTMISGLGINQMKKNNIPLTSVYPYKFEKTTLGNSFTYKFENETISIIITYNKKFIVLIRTKDSFSGQIAEIMYY